jgi:hypothetical protein
VGDPIRAKDRYLGPAHEGRVTAPAQKTGVRVEAQHDDAFFDTLAEGLDDALGAGRKLLKRATSKQAREDAAFQSAFEETMEELVLDTGKKMVESSPYLRVLVAAGRVSVAFANGAGGAFLKRHEELTLDYDRLIDSLHDDYGPEDIKVMHQVTGYLASNTKELAPVLATGLAKAVDEIIDILFELATEAVTGALKDAAGQLSKQILRQTELGSWVNQTIAAAAKPIDEKALRIEKIVFGTSMQALLDQLPKSKTRDALTKVAGSVKGEKGTVDSRVLATVIQLGYTQAYEAYEKAVLGASGVAPGATFVGELKSFLKDSSHQLLASGLDVKLVEYEGSEIGVKGKEVLVPPVTYAALTSPARDPAEQRRFVQRDLELWGLIDAADLAIKTKQLQLAQRQRRAPEESRVALHNRYVDVIKDEVARQRALIDEVLNAIVREFGDDFKPCTTTTWLRLHEDAKLKASNYPLPSPL